MVHCETLGYAEELAIYTVVENTPYMTHYLLLNTNEPERPCVVFDWVAKFQKCCLTVGCVNNADFVSNICWHKRDVSAGEGAERGHKLVTFLVVGWEPHIQTISGIQIDSSFLGWSIVKILRGFYIARDNSKTRSRSEQRDQLFLCWQIPRFIRWSGQDQRPRGGFHTAAKEWWVPPY